MTGERNTAPVRASRSSASPSSARTSQIDVPANTGCSSALPGSCSLPKDLRFRNRGQFQRAQQVGKRYYTRHLIAYLVLNSDQPTKLGVTVSKKVGKAHQRSYLKRLIREAFRHSTLRSSSGFDVSLIAKRDMPYPKLPQLISELDDLARGSTKLKKASHRSKSGKTQKRRRHQERARVQDSSSTPQQSKSSGSPQDAVHTQRSQRRDPDTSHTTGEAQR